MERKAGVPISIEALRCRPLKGELGLTNLIVKGCEGQWQHAYFLKVQLCSSECPRRRSGRASSRHDQFDLGTHLTLRLRLQGKMVDAMRHCAGGSLCGDESYGFFER